MLTYEKLMSWRPDALSSTADQLNADRKRFIDLQDEIDQGKPPESWIGQAATSANSTYPRLSNDLNDLVAEVSPVIQALDDAASTIKSSQDHAQTTMTTIESRGWIAKFSSGGVEVSDPSPRDDLTDDQAKELASVMQGFADDLQDALDKADQADADLAAVLGNVRAGTYDGGNGSIEQAALPPDLRGLSGQALIDRLLSDPAKYRGYVDALPVSDQQALGDAIAEEAGPISGAHSGTSYETHPMSQADLDKLNAAVAAYGNDPTVATQVANDVGTDGLLNIQQAVDGLYLEDGTYDPGSVGASQRAWGNLLATATRGITSDDAPGTTEHVSANWAERLTDRGGDVYDTGQSEQMYGYKLIGPLLRDDSHGSWFLNHVGDQMEQFEHDYMADHDGESPWDRAETPRQIDFTHGVAEVGTDSGDPTDAQMTEPTGADPFGGLFEGLSHNPDAAREFLSGDGPYDESRIHHYLSDRAWPHHSDHGGEWPTSQRYFGDALVAATTGDVHGQKAGDLATEALNVAAERIDVSDQEDGGLPPELRRDFAQIANGYMPDVYSKMSDGDVQTYWGQYEHRPAHLNLGDLSQSDLRQVLGDIGKDRVGYDIAHAGAGGYLSVGLDHELGNGPLTEDGALRTAKNDVIDPYSNIRGALQEGWDTERLNETKDIDAAISSEGDGKYRAGAWILDQAAGKTIGQIPYVGDIANGVVTSGIDAGADHLAGRNDVNSVNATDEEIASMIGDDRNSLQGLVDSAVYRHLSPHDLAGTSLVQHGHLVPMSQWTHDQVADWERFRSENPKGAIAPELLNEIVDQTELGRDHADSEQGR